MKRELQGTKPSFVIVGAGPAGLILGILLSRKGYPVAILERESGPQRQVCGEYLSPQGVAYLEALGIGEHLRGYRRLLGMKMSSPLGRQVLARFPEQKFGLALNRYEFTRSLSKEFHRHGGLLFYGESPTSVEILRNGLCIRTSGMEHICDALIGADGRSSHVAKLMGWERIPTKKPRVAIHVYLEPRAPLPPTGQMHLFPDGSYAGINPISGKEVNFSIVADASRLKNRNAKELLNEYITGQPGLSRKFRALTTEAVKTTYPIDCHRRQIASDRAALIGDASGFIDPLTGEGITTAIKTAALLFEKIEQEPTIAKAFQDYSRARRRDFRQKENLNRALQKVIRHPLLCEGIAIILQVFPRARSLFIGVIGNIYTPTEAMRNLFIGEKNDGQNRICA